MSGHQRITRFPDLQYVDIHDHRSHQVVGHLPYAIFAAITGSPYHGNAVWISAKQSQRIREHPEFVSAPAGYSKET